MPATSLPSLNIEFDMTMAMLLALPIIPKKLGMGIGWIFKGFNATAVSHLAAWFSLVQGDWLRKP